GFPDEFSIFLNYMCALQFDENPNYSYLHKLFRYLFICKGFKFNYIFDWNVQQGVPNNGRTGAHQMATAGRRKV
ncbi:hypothetical protein PAXRUDRAFT_76280, partial [Paxillus rubicundulus Ve08.2h10]